MRVQSSTGGQSASVNAWQQKQQGFSALSSALKSGDLKAAQAAYAKLSNGSGNSNGNGPLAQIGQALQNGDLAGAQKAEQTMRSHRGGHHHHDQDGDANKDAQAAPPTPVAPAATATDVGTVLDTLA